MLKELEERYPFMPALFSSVVQSKLLPASDLHSRLCNLNDHEASRIGTCFAMCLAANLTPEAAVEDWFGRFRALQILEGEFEWFTPMAETIAHRTLLEVAWGLKLRVTLGAGLSIMDMLSDLYIIYIYLNTDGMGNFAFALLLMVLQNVMSQLLVVLVTRSKASEIARECLNVIFLMKPAIDAYRIASGKKRKETEVLTPFMEMVFVGFVELFSQGIPGVILRE